MPFLKKTHPGGDSFGHQWINDGDVVEVTDEEAGVLLRIPANDFTVVNSPDKPVEVAEPAPTDEVEVVEAPKRRGRPPKAANAPVEE